MNIIYLTKILNYIFILSGNGSAKFVKRTWMLLCYAWRFTLMSVFLINVHNGIKWTLNNVRDIMEPISIVLIMSVHLKLLGPLFSIAWRIYFDNEFSNILKKCMDTLDVFKKCNSEVVLRAKIFWTFVVFILIHIMAWVTAVLGFFNTPDYSFFRWIVWICICSYNYCLLYEYMFLITLFQIIVYKLNEEIWKGIIPINKLGRMYANTMDDLDVINRFIYGPQVLVNIIMGHMCSIVYILYHYVLFKGMFIKLEVHRFIPILYVSIKLFNVFVLFCLCQTTEKEINRTNFILNKRFLTENLINRRKIAFFSLQRLHGNFQFELCGFHKINLRQFLSLLFKTILFLIIQIQLNIKSLTQSLS